MFFIMNLYEVLKYTIIIVYYHHYNYYYPPIIYILKRQIHQKRVLSVFTGVRV